MLRLRACSHTADGGDTAAGEAAALSKHAPARLLPRAARARWSAAEDAGGLQATVAVARARSLRVATGGAQPGGHPAGNGAAAARLE